MSDAPDWTVPLTIVDGATMPGADFPDWTEAVVAEGGSIGRYASLTGPGETVTPGLLDQEGGLIVNDNGEGITMASTGAGRPGIYLTANGPVTVESSAPLGSVGVEITTLAGRGIVSIDSAEGVSIKGTTEILLEGAGLVFEADVTSPAAQAILISSAGGFIQVETSSTFDLTVADPGGSGHFTTIQANTFGLGLRIQTDQTVTVADGVDVAYLAADMVGKSVTVGAAPVRNVKVGFYGSAGTLQPTITGSRAGNAALASLLAALAGMGLIVDATSP